MTVILSRDNGSCNVTGRGQRAVEASEQPEQVLTRLGILDGESQHSLGRWRSGDGKQRMPRGEIF